MSSSGSGTVINYGSGSGSDFLTSYGSGYGSVSGSGSTTLDSGGPQVYGSDGSGSATLVIRYPILYGSGSFFLFDDKETLFLLTYPTRTSKEQYGTCCPVLRIRDILVWIRIRIRGSMPLTSGSGSWIRILLFLSLTFKMPLKN
jgi:hypothetical protein